MSLYRDEAIVLRTHPLGEADRIVTLLTRERGKVRAVAKGVRRTRSRFGARLEPFMMTDIQLYSGRNLDTVTQVETIAAYGEKIVDDYPRYTAGTVMLETADRLTDEGTPAVQQFLLLVGGLRTLTAAEHESGLVLDAYLLRALSVAGWAPSFSGCARCGDPGPHRAFSSTAGGVVCPSCRPAGAISPATSTLQLLSALLTGDWACADRSSPADRKAASGLVAAYVQWHLERAVRALRMVEHHDRSN